MSKLEELKKFVAENYHEASEPEEIEKQVKLNNLIKEAEAESNEILDSNVKLSKAYRELIAGTAGKNEPTDNEDKRGIMPSFDEALRNAANGKDIYGNAKQN